MAWLCRQMTSFRIQVLMGIRGTPFLLGMITFERLVQPPPDAGFIYAWLNASSIPATSMKVFALNGLTPCCVPVGTNRVSLFVFLNRLHELYSRMRMCFELIMP